MKPLAPPALRLLPALDEPDTPDRPPPAPVSGEQRLWAAIREPGPCTAWLLGLRKEGA